MNKEQIKNEGLNNREVEIVIKLLLSSNKEQLEEFSKHVNCFIRTYEQVI